jgi:hypothetical protein
MGLDELIVAKRTHGRVDEHDGEYVETERRRVATWIVTG